MQLAGIFKKSRFTNNSAIYGVSFKDEASLMKYIGSVIFLERFIGFDVNSLVLIGILQA